MPAPLSIPCPQVIRGCDCTNDPVSNYSSEAADHEVFYGSFNQPPTTGTFFAPGCTGVCESVVSQELADECAARNAFDCSFDGAPRFGNPAPHGIFPPQRFGNALQECTAECGDGNSITVIEPPGTVVTATQADADARALSLACKRAKELLVCFVTTSPLAQGNVGSFVSVPIIATGGNGDYLFTIESGSLPPGITFDDVGLLLGTPTLAGTYTFEIRVDDTGGGTATRTFTWVIADACGVTTDWCAHPGACRLRIKDFNLLDWTYVWDGNLDELGGVAFPCFGFNDGADAGANYCPTCIPPRWQFSILCPDFSVYLADGPVGPSNTPPMGTYTKAAGSDPLCVGPNSFDIEIAP